MNMSVYNLYILQNIAIIIYLIVCFTWSLSNKDNLFQKLAALPLIRNNVLYFGLWHSWNMFVNPTRTNTILYLNIEFEDNTQELLNLYDPSINTFINRNVSVHDTKYVENLISDNNIRIYFCEFLFKFYTKQYNKKITKIILMQNFTTIPDFFTKNNAKEQVKVLGEWPT